MSYNLFPQVVTGVSESKFVNITSEPLQPPFIEIEKESLRFTDINDNNIIDANETSYLHFTVRNTGQGPGLNLRVMLQETGNKSGLEYDKETSLGSLPSGESLDVKLPISADMSLLDGLVTFNIRIEETNGFGTDPIPMQVQTKKFASPLIKVVDYSITSKSGTTIQKKVTFGLQALVQNIGQGMAEDVTVNVIFPENIYCLSNNQTVYINNLLAGQQQVIEYSLVTTINYSSTEIPITFEMNEKLGEYAENYSLTLAMNQAVSNEKIVVQGKEEEDKIIVFGSLTSIVDKDIPINRSKNPNRIALIIGNEDYSENLNPEVNVPYAISDASIFKEYAVKTLGVEEKNTFLCLNATAGKMQAEIERIALLAQMIDNAELIFYYAGHGFPDESTNIPYLIPVDVTAANLGSAIRLSDVYERFANTGAKRITVFLDACFSGGGRNQGLLAARSIAIKPKDERVSGNMVVYAASTGEQSALPYEEEKHGMFTYFLLKKLQETKGDITYSDLAEYLKQNVCVESLRVNRREQDPIITASPSVTEIWKDWSFK